MAVEETEPTIKSLPEQKAPAPGGSLESLPHVSGETVPVQYNPSQSLGAEGRLPDSSWEASVTPIPNPDQELQKNGGAVSPPTNTDAKPSTEFQ